MAGGLTSAHYLVAVVLLLAATDSISGEFTYPKEETVRNVLSSGDQFIVGTTGALYDISMTNGQSQLQRRQLTGPSRLLVSVDEGMYRNLVLNCDDSMCLLVERSNFSQIVWSYPSAMILRESTENSVGIFAISADDTPDLLYVDSPLSNTPARIVRGVLMDINLSGSPANPTFTQVVVSTEAVIERDFQFYLEFTDSNFLYLVSDRHSLENAPKPAARVLRFCANDSDSNRRVFRSYFEVKLSCGTGTAITAATFFSSNKTTSFAQPVLVISAQSETTGESYVCSYSLNSINAAMQAKFDECRIGNGQAGFTRYGASLMEDCRDLTSQQLMMCRLPALYFPGLEVGTNLAPGTLLGRTFLTGEEITSVTATLLQGNFYVFAGSNRANIHQYAVNTSSIRYIRTVSVVTTPTAISHLVTASSSDKLFAFTSNKIIEYEVDQCSLSTTCTDCLSTGDALCGWCTLRSACVSRQSCLPVLDRESEERSVFAEGSTNQCPSLTRATPSVIHLEQLTTAVPITLSTMNVLNHGGSFSYQCHFSFQSTSSSSPEITGATANVSGNSFTCPSPPLSDIPSIPAGTDHVSSLVTIRLLMPSDSQTTPLVTMDTPISFTNCSVHTSCASCRGSVVGMCLWCPLSFACVSDLGESSRCPNNPSIQVAEIPQPSCSANILPSPDSSSGQYLVHANYQYQQPPLRILSEGLGIFSNAMFGCRLCTESGCSGDSVVKTSEATLANNWVTCDFTRLNYNSLSGQRPKDTLYLQVLVGNAVIDNPNRTSVLVYTCPFLGTNCGQCLTIDSTHGDTFNCTYCGSMVGAPGNCTLTLEPSNMCTGVSVFSTIDDCDAPSVTDFFPKNGPIEGRTMVSVTGINLGTVRSHISKVTIGTVNCSVVSDSYRPGVGFNCTTKALLSSLFSDSIFVHLNFPSSQHMIRSSQSFSYLSPTLSNPPAMPNKGPEAGGTLITVVGSNIGIGSSHKVLIRNMACKITTVQTDSITCLTPSSNGTSFNNILKLSVDGFMASGIGFDYEENPVFESIEPKVAFFSGGTIFMVRGQNMDVVQRPYLIFYIGQTNSRRKRQTTTSTTELRSEPCTVVNASLITCLAPTVNSTSQMSASDISIGLVMDGVASLLQLNSSIMVHPDPTIIPFPSVLQFSENQNFHLTIRGDNFVFTNSQVEVLIECRPDIARCPCTNVQVHSENNSIVCHVRDPQDLPINRDLSVTVNIGFLSVSAGQIRIRPNLELIFYLVPVFVVIIIFCVVIFIVLFAVFYRKARQKDERYDQLMVELEKLESSVARECKLGFAELQTDLDELTGDVAGCRLPYHHIRTYLMATLFPGNREHPVLHPLQVPEFREKTMKRALSDFSDLLSDRKILLFLIQTLEEQRSFTIRDKSIVGSLLVIILHNRMDYATDVLKKLLSQLIRKTVTNSNPKLLLRRTESIAEKMLTNWLTLCLHGYMMEHAGQPMYLLYRAVKNQLEKGPVDVITGEARYSLSEQKLIRQKVDVVAINATVEAEDGLKVPVKLLDCDTISQAKEKLLDTMFKAAPVSQRPKLTDVDLEYLRSASETIILRDEDHTTVVESGWKNINTLKHYWVSDNASFRIVTRKETAPPGRAYDYLGSLISTHTRRQRALSEAEDGSRVWHLFKQVDSEDPRRSPFLNKKMVSEIYLPRMLSTKSILQNFVDELFNALFSVNHPPSSPTTMYTATFPQSPGIQVPMGYAPGAETVPMAIKYLFDFLDEEAEHHHIADPDVVHTWKNNALSLRFWVNMIKNPEFVFDINKSHTVDACLSVIAQAFIDGCSPADAKLTIDSPTSKLLYNKEVQGYKSKVRKYYSSVKNMPKIPEDAMEHYLRQLSEYQCQQMKKVGSFEQDVALNELLRYATHYSNQFLHTLRAAGLQHRAQQFENILLQTQPSTATLI